MTLRIPATVSDTGRHIVLSIYGSQLNRGASDRTAVDWAKSIGVSVDAVRRALRALERDGFVIRKTPHGSRRPVRVIDTARLESAAAGLAPRAPETPVKRLSDAPLAHVRRM